MTPQIGIMRLRSTRSSRHRHDHYLRMSLYGLLAVGVVQGLVTLFTR